MKHACPSCGEVWDYPDRRRSTTGGWQPVTRVRMNAGAGIPAESFAEYERIEPVRAPTVAGDFLTPLLQAVVTALAAGVLGVGITIMVGWPWYAPLAIAGLAFAFSWLLLMQYFNGLLVARERVINDVNARRPPQEIPVKRVRLEVKEDAQTTRLVDLPLAPATLATVARAVQNGRPFSVSSLTGRGKPLTRGEFEGLRDWLLSSGYARWTDADNRRAGVTFTAKGKALLKGLAS